MAHSKYFESCFWACSVPECRNASSVDLGACERCSSHYCVIHMKSPAHACPDEPLGDDAWEAARLHELESLRGKINLQKLLEIARTARGGIPCDVVDEWPFGKTQVGGMHAHMPIAFTDGVTWLARIPRDNFTSFSDQLTNGILWSEFATLKWLETTGVPAPRAYAYGLRNDPANAVGVAYILIEKLPGVPFIQLQPDEEQTRRVYSQWVSIQGALHKYPWDLIGCLTLAEDETYEVGPVLGDRTGALSSLGPFQNASSYYSALAQDTQRMIEEGQLFGRNSSTASLVYKYLHHMASSGKCNVFEKELDAGPFFLKHMDDKGDHLLVDEDFNITGVIDWTFARVVPAYEAFGPSLVTADLGSLVEGKSGLSHNDRLMAEAFEAEGSPLTRYAKGDDRVRRFGFGLGVGMGLVRDELESVSECIFNTFGGNS